MKNISKSLFILFTLVAFAGHAQMTKGTKGTFALTNAKVVTITNGTINNGTVVIENGVITAVGTNLTIPEGATTIDCSGKSIYPGMIDAGTSLGLVEVSSVAETRDNRELGNVNPHIKALTAINPNSVAIPVTRVSGVTTVIAKPSGGLIPGTAALINLHGYTPEQMHAGFSGVVINFPSSGRRGRRDNRSEEDVKKDLDKALKSLNDVFDKATEYAAIADAHAANSANPKPEYYPELEALVPVVKNEMSILLEVNKASDIQNAIKWSKEKGYNVILTGVAEGWRVADEIAKSGFPVITGPVIATPTRSSDKYDRPYANAGVLSNAGVKVGLRTNDTENVRNLPFNAGFAVAYGMKMEDALKSVTINTAEILGVSDKLGSIEVGKTATLFVSTGDPFETKTTIEHVFIDGWQIPIDSRHIRLYQEFLERSPGVSK